MRLYGNGGNLICAARYRVTRPVLAWSWRMPSILAPLGRNMSPRVGPNFLGGRGRESSLDPEVGSVSLGCVPNRTPRGVVMARKSAWGLAAWWGLQSASLQ